MQISVQKKAIENSLKNTYLCPTYDDALITKGKFLKN